MANSRDASVTGARTRGLLSFAGLVLALSTVVQPVKAQEQERAKVLLPLLLSAIAPSLQAGVGCLFERLIRRMGAAAPSLNCIQPNTTTVVQPGEFLQGGQSSQAGLVSQGGGAQGMTPPPMLPSQQVAQKPPLMPSTPMNNTQAVQLAQTPVFSFIVNKLTDNTPQAQIKEVVQFDNVAQGTQILGFNIKTGESFAVLFATTVPGRVRMLNTDVNQVVTASDVYEALPGADNRMPRDWQGGIMMAGRAGTEYLDVEFTPCVSQQYINDPRVVQFRGLLPSCSQDSATKRYTPALPNGKGGVIGGGAKVMVFPPSANPGQPVALAPENYSRGGALTIRIIINHQTPG
jgi:hypothetical protein